MHRLIDVIGQAIGYNFDTSANIADKIVRLSVKAVYITIIKEEGYRNRDIINCHEGWNHQAINYAEKIFKDFIVSNKTTKELYLKATKAVEDNYES